MAIRAIFFDAGDTLIHRWAMKADRFLWLCQQAGVALPPDPSLRRAAAIGHDLFFQDRRKHADARSTDWYIRLCRAGLEAAGLKGDLNALSARINDLAMSLPVSYVIDPEAALMLEWLRAKGYRLAVVSNWDGSLVDALRAAGLGGYFDAALDSDVVGSAKPDRRIFEIACAATGVRPDEALHVGDSPGADVAGALAAGVQPVLLDALDVFGGGFDGLPRFDRIQRLSQLSALLQERDAEVSHVPTSPGDR